MSRDALTALGSVALLSFASVSASAADSWQNGDNISVPANIVYPNDGLAYEGLYTVQNQGQFEYRN